MNHPTYFVKRIAPFASPIQRLEASSFGVDIFAWTPELGRYALVGAMYHETAVDLHGEREIFLSEEEIDDIFANNPFHNAVALVRSRRKELNR